MSKILDGINSPADLKPLSLVDLNKLAIELREEMVTRVTANGGHLASSLGVVELTIALHKVFNCPDDKIVWDVGHQCYAHKLLTGRREQFATLRQYGGISGFTCRDESPYDAFTTGHASTSISAAVGMAAARDLSGDNYNVIAVIGDGAITGGMALEALNNAGHLGKRLIVILNDNGMSISPTVGAMSRLLGKVRFDRRYYKASEKSKRLLSRFDMGSRIWEIGQRIKGGMKKMVMPTTLWEEFGFAYTGPIDGHNINDLVSALEQAKSYSHKPALIHIVTTKGKGYGPAESDAINFHGISPKGSPKKTGSSHKLLPYSEIFARTVEKMAWENPKIAVITAAMPDGYCLGHMQSTMPNRIFDVGICEQHAVTFAAGMAAQGMTPIVAIYSTFLQRAFDQIIHDVALPKLPVVFALDRGGIVGEDGKTHQGIFDLSYLSLIPDMILASPKDENELQHLLYTATKCGKPMAIRYPRGVGTGVELEPELREIPVGSAEILRKGPDAALLATGASVKAAMAAADLLEMQGTRVTVVNMRYIRPLDEDVILGLASDIKSIITIEENVLNGGLGSLVAALLKRASMDDVGLKSLGIPDEFVTHGTQAQLRSNYHLDAEGISSETLAFIDEFEISKKILASR
ncbi:1-deoxy-D-xylulose-5-phosphate synthase [Dehalogenimonas etheniformans]|uniref:1-deoxy-D-xylulose-5-phosphate synthase n=1 Tax=Dehalogenimonas etheniformans TaxID=1536648 RepID=A0A2P5P9K2_9CHLR|nr:1-deoxy-D-xylulose-5-phosphate synthase [Dehalogenimonas etheniformans]PPD58954.1 1-deoxy-D-xylulose-5-phosphate synthase [Dehalogenimonas etheniformans]QNT76278.1 1-deoxy-D-xylulose-5-phosphate synthase [Dehalogenimonas etheniformans]